MNMKIRRLIFGGSALLVILLVSVILVAVFQIHTLDNTLTETNIVGRAAALARSLSLHTQYNASNLSAYVIGRREHREKFENRTREFNATAEALRASLLQISDSEETLAQLDMTLDGHQTYQQVATELFAAADARREAAQDLRALQLNSGIATGEVTVDRLQKQVADLSKASATLATRQKAENDAWNRAIALSDQVDSTTLQLFESLNTRAQQSMAISQLATSRIIAVLIGLGIISIILMIVTQGTMYGALGKPMSALLASARRLRDGDLSTRVGLVRKDEFGLLGAAFDEMADQLAADREQLMRRTAELEQALVEGERLFETVQALSTPVLPLLDGVVALPIIGHIDTHRGDAISNELLNGVSRHRAHTVILDLTGVVHTDTYVLNLLMRASKGARLLGARVIVVGISATAAQLIVQQGINLDGIEVQSSLQGALATLFAQREEAPAPHRNATEKPVLKLNGHGNGHGHAHGHLN